MPPLSTPEKLALRWVPGAGPVTLELLAEGLVNESYRVERDGRVYSMRVARAAADLGVDRGWECRVLECAMHAGLGPVIVCCEPALGILVSKWTGGRAWTAEELRQPDNVRAMAGLIRRVHALAVSGPARVMSPASWIDLYSRAAARGRAPAAAFSRAAMPFSAPPPSGAAASSGLRATANAKLELLARDPSGAPVLCHSDLHRFNVTVGERLVLLDWEYAHVSDPYWDLAAWIANNDGTAAFAAEVLAGYLERPAGEHEARHLRLMLWLYDYVCLLWSELYLARRCGAPADEVSTRARLLALRLKG